jgi:RNA polymerase sigma-70 factor (ECF subfamily)
MNSDNNGHESFAESSDVIQLAKDAVAGNDKAFEKLFGLYRDHLKQYVDLRLDPRLRPRLDASDVVQETQIDAHRRLNDFLARRPFPIRIWLRKLAHERMLNLYKMHLQTQKRSARREVPFPDRSSTMLAGQLVDGGLSPSQAIEQVEHRIAVARAINQLTETDREILLMHFIEGLSFPEVGCMLDITEAAATKRCARALQRLRAKIKDSGLETHRE